MKKKVFFISLIGIILYASIFCLTGCENKKDGDNKENTQNLNVQEKSDNKMIVDGFDLTLTQKSSLDNLKYKYPEGGVINSIGTATLITYVKDKQTDQLLFKILIGKMTSTTVEKAMAGKEFTKIGTKRFNNIDWEVYADEGNNNSYAYNYNGDTYAIGFVSYGNTGDLEQEFMKNVYFE